MASKNLRVGQFQIEATGYDRKKVLFWYLASNQAQQSMYLVHRGTSKNNPDDVLDDLDPEELGTTNPSVKNDFPYLSSNAKHLFVAQGFHSRFKNQQVPITAAVRLALKKHPSFSFVVIGHSLGAAWAFLDAGYFVSLSDINARMTAIYTFGQPLLGSSTFVDGVSQQLGDRYVRIVNKNDLIPHIGCLQCVQPLYIVEKWIQYIVPDTVIPTWIDCTGGDDLSCSAGLPCKVLSWSNHSAVGSFSMRGEFCNIRSNQ
ncbi:unnamed protein product [Didymodactylos carnosus]|uniref:Fungal lipase-type domain-containing protein n=1 Tax=Didymodactylos carnosus TaxID=1234261 RepID=A0A8S2PKF5_9BILA|nr:unnamed protein product [Didymodactylos carnosus]CAF4053299.1 unnamed protein product [Didymodactylos carnosus]